MSLTNRAATGVLGVVAVGVLAACTGPTRVATLNNSSRVAGSSAAATLQQQLAKQGHPNVTVSCAKSIAVYVGPAVSCTLSGAGTKHTVNFTFKTLGGVISLSSVKAS